MKKKFVLMFLALGIFVCTAGATDPILGSDEIVVGAGVGGGALYNIDITTPASSSLQLLNQGFGTIYDVSVLNNGRDVALGSSLDLGQGGGPGTVFHYDMAAALAGGAGSGQTIANTGLGGIYDIEGLSDGDFVVASDFDFGGGGGPGSAFHYNTAGVLGGGVGSGQTLLNTGLGTVGDVEALGTSTLLDGTVLSGGLFHYTAPPSPTQTLLSNGYVSFYDIETLSNGNAVYGTSLLSGSVYFQDVATGLATPGTGMTRLANGFQTIYDMVVLPSETEVILGSSLNSGSIYHIDFSNVAAPVLTLLWNGHNTIDEIEVLANGDVIVGSQVGGVGGTLYYVDVSAALAGGAGSGFTLLNQGFGTFEDIEALADGNFVIGSTLDLGQGGGPGSIFHYDTATALAGGLGSGQTLVGTGFGSIYDIEVLVPEPATVMLLGLGGLLLRRKRK